MMKYKITIGDRVFNAEEIDEEIFELQAKDGKSQCLCVQVLNFIGAKIAPVADDKTVEILQKFFMDCARNNLEVSSLTVADGFWDRLALKIGINHTGFYENEFTFNAPFGPVKIVRQNKRNVPKPCYADCECTKCGAKR